MSTFSSGKRELDYVTLVDAENATLHKYNTKKAVECELLDMMFFSPVRNSVHKKNRSTLGAVVIFVGGKKGRREALQWAEYHRIIGIDHIWLYVNEQWEYQDFALFNRPYISCIPFNLTLRNYPNANSMKRGYFDDRNLGRVFAMKDAL